MVIANRLTITDLGLYSAVSQLSYYPMAVVGRFLSGIQMPLVAGSADSPVRRAEVLDSVAGDTNVLAMGLVVGFTLLTPYVLVPLYGARFAQSMVVIALVGFLQACRLMRFWPTTVALGIGRSAPIMIANMVRLFALPLAFMAVALGYGLPGLICAFILGELVAGALNLVMVNAALARRLLSDVDRLVLLTVTGCACVAVGHALSGHRTPEVVGAGTALLAVGVWAVLRERRSLLRWLTALRRFIPRWKRDPHPPVT